MYIILLVIYKYFFLLKVVFLEAFDMCLFGLVDKYFIYEFIYRCILYFQLYISIVFLLKVVFLETFGMCLFWSYRQKFFLSIHMFMCITLFVREKFFLETLEICFFGLVAKYFIYVVIYLCILYFQLYISGFFLKVVFLETFDMCLCWSCCQIFYV